MNEEGEYNIQYVEPGEYPAKILEPSKQPFDVIKEGEKARRESANGSLQTFISDHLIAAVMPHPDYAT